MPKSYKDSIADQTFGCTCCCKIFKQKIYFCKSFKRTEDLNVYQETQTGVRLYRLYRWIRQVIYTMSVHLQPIGLYCQNACSNQCSMFENISYVRSSSKGEFGEEFNFNNESFKLITVIQNHCLSMIVYTDINWLTRYTRLCVTKSIILNKCI